MKVTRSEFLKRAVQVVLAGMLAVVAITLGKRTVSGNDCSGCPGNGKCKGESDCSNFLAEQR